MKVFALLIAFLNIASVHSVIKHPFKVPEVTPESIGTNPLTRIYGGTEAKDGQFPYMIFVLMSYRDGRITRCSASLLKSDIVLLAAHCVEYVGPKPTNIIVVGGKADLERYVKERIRLNFNIKINETVFGLQERRAEKVHTHPQFNPESLEHDVALIVLDEPFNSTAIKTIPWSEEKLTAPKFCTILGWGLTEDNPSNLKLNFVENKKVRTTKIGCTYKETGPFICLVPDRRGICQGDSGSPLVCDNKVWGIASHLVSMSENPNCGDSLEEYYSELHSDLEWVKSIYNGGNQVSVISFKTLLVCVFAALWVSIKS